MNFNKESDIVNFGKFKGKTIGHILSISPDYIIWMSNNCNNIVINKELFNKALLLHSSKKRYCFNSYMDDRQMDADFASAFDWGSQ